MIKLLDCTLRDGGYINNWEFGYEAIKDMIARLEATNVDILELGFLKSELYDSNRTVFNSMEQIASFIPNKRKDIDYAAMIEVVNPIPLDMLSQKTTESVDIIRVIVWKTKHNDKGEIVDALQEGFDYCKGIVEKGYKLCVQPARVDQYTDDEFLEMLLKFQELNPLAIYVVDSWGTQNTNQIMHYVDIAHNTLKKDIAIGYHGHNNLMQAFGTASVFVENPIDRDLIIDASVYGIGRGAGNLNLELFAKYLNDTKQGHYNVLPMIEIYEKYIKKIYNKHKWGFSIPYYLTAQYNCNPNYGEYYDMVKQLSVTEMQDIFEMLSDEDKVLFSIDKAENYMKFHKMKK